MSTPVQLYMDAVITPNRSLSKRGLWLLLGVMGAYNLVLTVFLLVIGAFPVPIFLGLDLAGVALAFHISNRRARRAERVQVSHDTVRVLRDGPGEGQVVWSSPTAFTRVQLDGEEDALAVSLRLSGRSLLVGRALSPEERSHFARALSDAIRKARSERYAGP